MPRVIDKATGQEAFVANENLEHALQSGQYALSEGATIQVKTPSGRDVEATPEQLAALRTSGLKATPATEAERAAADRAARIERQHGGALGAAGTFVEQGVDTATFGAYGAATDLALGDDYTENRRERLEANPVAGTAGTVVGALAPALLSGGAGTAGALARFTPAGAAARLAETIAGSARGSGIFLQTAAEAAGAGVEGALFNSGHVLAETVLQDKELSAEAFISGAADGLAWGGAFGAGGSLVSRGVSSAEGRVSKLLEGRRSEAELDEFVRTRAKEVEADKKHLKKMELDNNKSLNRRADEEFKQKGRIEIIEKRAEAQKDVIGARGDADLQLAQERGSTQIKVADLNREKEVSKVQARVALKEAELDEASELLQIERERTARAKLNMDGRRELAETYTGGWARAADSREAVASTGLEAAKVGAEAKVRTGLADARVRATSDEAAGFVESLTPAGMRHLPEEPIQLVTRRDPGPRIEEVLPARLRTPQAADAARVQALNETSHLASSTDDLVRQADDLAIANPHAARGIASVRDHAAQASAELVAWNAKAAATGIEDFGESFKVIRKAEEARHDLAQAIRPSLDDASAAHVDEVLQGMGDAIEGQREILDDAIVKRAEAQAPRPGQEGIAEEVAKEAAQGAAVDSAGTPATTLGTPSREAAKRSHGLDELALLNEVAGDAGIHVEDVPVVGPVLKWYLKYRAIRGALHKFGVHLPGPVGRIARTAATQQDRALEVVSLGLRGAANAANVARQATPALTSILSRSVWEPAAGAGKPPASQAGTAPKPDAEKLYRLRSEEVSRAVANRDATREKILASIKAPPRLAASIADAYLRRLDYLAAKMPKDPRGAVGVELPFRPSRVELLRFADVTHAVTDPVAAMARAMEGRLRPEGVQAVRDVFPRLFASMQQELIQRMADEPEVVRAIPFPQKVRISNVLDVPLGRSTTAEFASERQAEYAAMRQAAPQSPPASGPALRLSNLEELSSRRSSRR